MDPLLSDCLYPVVHLCLEVCLLLNQLYQFERELAKLFATSNISPRDFLSIFERFSLTLEDLNHYYKNQFSSCYSNVLISLSHEYSMSFSPEESNDEFIEEIDRLNFYLHHHRPFCQKLFHCLHRLHIACSLSSQYRQKCSNEEFYHRFIYLRVDFFQNLIELKSRLRSLLKRTNRNFQRRQQNISFKVRSSTSSERFQIENYHLARTIFLWIFVISIFGYYFLGYFVRENSSGFGWPI